MAAATLRRATAAELDTATLYSVLRLRSAVFVVEQDCAYLDLDGRDLEDGAVHLWIEEDSRILSCLRLLPDGEGSLIGRVVTDAAARRRGLGERLMLAALDEARRPVLIKAQARLRDWYARFGFRPIGPEFDEDGIPHVPMRLD